MLCPKKRVSCDSKATRHVDARGSDCCGQQRGSAAPRVETATALHPMALVLCRRLLPSRTNTAALLARRSLARPSSAWQGPRRLAHPVCPETPAPSVYPPEEVGATRANFPVRPSALVSAALLPALLGSSRKRRTAVGPPTGRFHWVFHRAVIPTPQPGLLVHRFYKSHETQTLLCVPSPYAASPGSARWTDVLVTLPG